MSTANVSTLDPNMPVYGVEELSMTPAGKLRTISAFTQAAAITKSDTTVYSPPIQSLWIGGTGNVNVVMVGTTTAVVITGVPTGTLLPFAVSKVMSTSTTATAIVGLY